MWDKIGGQAYDQMGSVLQRPLCLKLLERASLQSGQSVLDIATGTGSAALAAAEAVGPTGYVLGVDLSNALLETVTLCFSKAAC